MSTNDLERIRKWKANFPEMLPPANLRDAFFNSATYLEGAVLGNEEYGYVSLADVRWGGVNLTVVDWIPVKMLGDERAARNWKISEKGKNREERAREKRKLIDLYRTAVRANRQLTTALRDQGLSEEAAYFAYRALLLQQKVLWYQVLWGQVELLGLYERVQKFASYIFSMFLDLLSGYGYKPGRSLFWYLLVNFGFATFYYTFVHAHLSWNEALILSIVSFHGRGFFALPIPPSDILGDIAALEAVIGLLTEISFIAAFTQRFFGK